MKIQITPSPDVVSVLMGLGEMLSVARRARGETQSDAAERCGVHIHTIARIERGDHGVAVGTVFTLMSMYGLKERLFDLADLDETTEILLKKNLPERARK